MPDTAVTRSRLAGRGRPGSSLGVLLAQGLSKRAPRHAVVVTNQGKVLGFGIVTRRRGASCWEVERLEVARDAESAWPELLEGLGGPVSIQGGQRLILRLAEGSALDRAAREAEFKPYCHEEHFVLAARVHTPGREDDAPGVRLAVDDDEFGLYQLYRAASPPPVREAEGLTVDQWKESRPLLTGWRTQGQYVFEREGRIAGWAAVSRRGSAAMIEILSTDAKGEAAGALTGAALQGALGASAVSCLVPGYQQVVASALIARGFVKRASHVLYVKHVTARVRQPEIAMARA